MHSSPAAMDFIGAIFSLGVGIFALLTASDYARELAAAFRRNPKIWNPFVTDAQRADLDRFERGQKIIRRITGLMAVLIGLLPRRRRFVAPRPSPALK